MAYNDDGVVDQARTLADLKRALELIGVNANEWNQCPQEDRRELVKKKLRRAQLKYHSDKTINLSEEEKQKYAENFTLVTRIFATEFDDIKTLNTDGPILRFFSSASQSDWELFCTAMSRNELDTAAMYLDFASCLDRKLCFQMLDKVAELNLDDQRRLLSHSSFSFEGNRTNNVLMYAFKRAGFSHIDSLNQLLAKIQNLPAETGKQIISEIGLIELTQLFYLSIPVQNADVLQNIMNTLLKGGASLIARDSNGLNLLDYVIRNHPEMGAYVLFNAHTLSKDAQQEFLKNTPFRTAPATREAAEAEMDFLRKNYVNQVNGILQSSGFDKHYKIIDAKVTAFHNRVMDGRCGDVAALGSSVRLKNELEAAKNEFLSSASLDVNENERLFKARCQRAINAARPVLEQHRGWSKLLAGFLLALITWPISLPAYALGFFSIKTDSAEKLDAFEKELNSKPSGLGA